MHNRNELHKLGREFAAAYNARDMDRFDRLFHPDFRWHIAVTEYDDPQMRPLHSKLLAGRNLMWPKSIFDKAETIEIFRGIFARTPEFSIEVRSITADEDRVVVEAVGTSKNQDNGRRYDNLYCYVFEARDGQIVLFREYQDTLLLFDVWVAE